MTKEQYERLGFNYEYSKQAEEFITKPMRLLEFQWFMNHTPFGEEEVNYLTKKFGISKDLIDFIKFELDKTPSWIVRLANGISDNYRDCDLGFKEYMDKKAGFRKICANCAFFDKDNEYCERGDGSYTSGDNWRLCCTKK